MKFKIAILLCVTVIALTGCFSKAEFHGEIQQVLPSHLPLAKGLLMLGNVESLQVVGGLPGTKGSQLFQKSDDKSKEIITKIVGWINSAKPVKGQTDYGKHGYPMVITIKMNDGSTVSVEPAYDCVTKTNVDGSVFRNCTPITGELVIFNDSKTLVESSELYKWLKEDWQQEK